MAREPMSCPQSSLSTSATIQTVFLCRALLTGCSSSDDIHTAISKGVELLCTAVLKLDRMSCTRLCIFHALLSLLDHILLRIHGGESAAPRRKSPSEEALQRTKNQTCDTTESEWTEKTDSATSEIQDVLWLLGAVEAQDAVIGLLVVLRLIMSAGELQHHREKETHSRSHGLVL